MENTTKTDKATETGNALKTLWVERAEKRKEATNNALNINLTVRQAEKSHKVSKSTEKAVTHTYKIDSEAIKKQFSADYGVSIDNLIKSQSDTETAVFLKITAVNQMRKYAKDNLIKFLEA